MKILVTGSAGFIGSNLVEYILTTFEDIEVVSLDKLDYAGHEINLAQLPGGVSSDRHRLIVGSICDPDLVNDIVSEGIDGIINVAAHTHVDRAYYHPELFVENNVEGPLNLLRAVEKHKIGRILQVSTDEVYGETAPDKPFDEASPLRPGNYYAATKASADLCMSAAVNSKDIDAVIIRGANNFGPRQYPEKLIPFFTRRILNGKRVPIYGKGNQMRDWLYVKDFCRAIWKVFSEGKKGEIYNAGAGNHVSNLEITQTIIMALGASTDLVKHVADRPGHDFCYAVDSSKLRELGWKPMAEFPTAMTETINWYRENSEWVKILQKKSDANPTDHEFFANHYKDRM